MTHTLHAGCSESGRERGRERGKERRDWPRVCSAYELLPLVIHGASSRDDDDDHNLCRLIDSPNLVECAHQTPEVH